MTQEQYGGIACPLLEETRICNGQACPVDCEVSAWSPWSPCSKTCGEPGTKMRNREIDVESSFGGSCPSNMEDSAACDEGLCPIHCSITSWGEWSACTATCGGGSHTHTREVTAHAQHGGFECPSLSESSDCNTEYCPTDCAVSNWTEWKSAYSASHPLDLKRTRQVVTAPIHGGISCPDLEEYKAWKDDHGADTHEYGAWSVCSKPCNSGHRYRYQRHVIFSTTAVVKYEVTFRQTELCNTHDCPDGRYRPHAAVVTPPMSP
jgi:hypothetical protein